MAVIGVGISEDLISSLGRLKSYILLPFLLSMVVLHLAKMNSSRLPLTFICASGAAIGVWAMGEVAWGLLDGDLVRPTAIYDWNVSSNVSRGGFANFIGLFLTPLWPVAAGLWHTAQTRIHRLRMLVLVLAITGGIFASQSYSAIAIMFLSAGLYLYFFVRAGVWSLRRALQVGSVFLIGVLLCAGSQISTSKFEQLTDMSERNSITSRIQIWHTSLVILRENPILGIGLADFQRVYEDTIPTLYFPPHEWLVPEPHNVYLATWLHTGVFGFFAFLGMGIHGVRALKQTYAHRDWLWVGLGIGFLTMYAHGLFDTTVWKNDLAVIFFVWYVLLISAKTYEEKPES
jgi:O-antigen ligase